MGDLHLTNMWQARLRVLTSDNGTFVDRFAHRVSPVKRFPHCPNNDRKVTSLAILGESPQVGRPTSMAATLGP